MILLFCSKQGANYIVLSAPCLCLEAGSRSTWVASLRGVKSFSSAAKVHASLMVVPHELHFYLYLYIALSAYLARRRVDDLSVLLFSSIVSAFVGGSLMSCYLSLRAGTAPMTKRALPLEFEFGRVTAADVMPSRYVRLPGVEDRP